MVAVTRKKKSCHVEGRYFGLASSCSGSLSFESDKNGMRQTHFYSPTASPASQRWALLGGNYCMIRIVS